MRQSLSVTLFLCLINIFASSVLAQNEIAKDLVITLERTACFGWCPSYTLTIKAEGTITLTPLGGVYRGQGKEPALPLKGTIEADRLTQLVSEFHKIRFYSLRGRYGRAEKSERSSSCPEYSTDSPSATISIAENGRRKTVSHYLGCKGAKILDDLEALENKIDELSNSQQWIALYGWGTANVLDLRIEKKPKD